MLQRRRIAAGQTSMCLSLGFMQASQLLVVALAVLGLLLLAPSAAAEWGEAELEEGEVKGVLTADNDFTVLPHTVRGRLLQEDDMQLWQGDPYANLDYARGALTLANQSGDEGNDATRVAPAMCYGDRLLPNLFLFGTPKAGSTTLWAYLVSGMAGNKVWSFPKEQKYFGIYREGWTATKLAQEYASRFPPCTDANNGTYYVLDGTPAYIYRDLAPEQIVQVYGVELSRRLKFIATLRNPADRILSFFNGFGRSHRYIPCNADFDEWAVKEADATDLCFRAVGMQGDIPQAYRRCQRTNQFVQSWHAMHLFKWFDYFSPDQFLFVDFDDMNRDPKGTVQKMFEFLGIPFNDSTFAPLVANIGAEKSLPCTRQPEMLPSTRKVLDDFFRPLNVQLRNIMMRTGHGDSVPSFAARDYDLVMSQKSTLTQ